MTPQPARWHKW